MSKNTFFISDTHFGHEKTCTVFKNEDGSPLRPFANAAEMDEAMVERWNAVVKPEDKVYHLGDVVINKKFLNVVSRLNGHKRLIRGNHDIMKTQQYVDVGFKEIYGVRVVVDNFILSHIPLHPDCVNPRFRINVHGHLHGNVLDDPRYISVCVEQINYTPISLEDLNARVKSLWERHNYEPTKGTWGNGSPS